MLAEPLRDRQTAGVVLEDVRRRRVAPPGSPVAIALLDWGGDGPPALLHHANGFCAALWDPVARRLNQHYRVFGMDARGHGDSDRPEEPGSYRWRHFGGDAEAVARMLATEHSGGRIALGLGHSFGGTALLTAAAHAPGLFARLVLVDPIIPPPRASGEGPSSRGAAIAERARRRRQVWPDRDAVRAAWEHKDLFADWDPRIFDLYLAEALRDLPDGRVELKCPGRVEATIFEGSGDSDVWSLARRVTVPVLVLWAMRGNFRRDHFEALAAEMPDARVCGADAGHLIPMERPDLVADAVLGGIPADQTSTG